MQHHRQVQGAAFGKVVVTLSVSKQDVTEAATHVEKIEEVYQGVIASRFHCLLTQLIYSLSHDE